MGRRRQGNKKLTDLQKKFCEYYAELKNGSKSACLAGYKRENARSTAYKLLRRREIQNYIREISPKNLNQFGITEFDIVQKYIDIAFSDTTDYSTVEDGKVKFKNFKYVDGTLIQGLKQGRDGIEVRLLDKMRALEWLSKWAKADRGLEHKIKIDNEKLKLEKERLKAEIESDENYNDSIDKYIKATQVEDLDKLFEDEIENGKETKK